MDFFRMYAFHLKRYGSQSYFAWLVLTSTVGLLLLRYLVVYANGQSLTSHDVLMATVLGLWNSAITAAGILHFQRSQGVLVYLVNAAQNTWQSLAALVSSSATFGLIAFPIAEITAFLLNGGSWPTISGHEFLALILFWLAALPMTYVLAALFLLTRNAFVYESLFATPVLILSGLFGDGFLKGKVLQALSELVPIRFPIQLLFDGSNWEMSHFIYWVLVIFCWLAVATIAVRNILQRVRVSGELEVL
ncbi:hypothetical protein H7198_03410 [Fructobacillus sp. CRL 2054]|uniref:hypothetical protein n=1 Tax=Fructobacillus sp. CRL 2054 TaxID=2763007 RepID=UPI002378CDB7|nr:hypothetical protein [Fructobacillus sp. CRL 2054]MDD9138649.1 hypothetical protein [Fructobacillus sp. CRL 2054]